MTLKAIECGNRASEFFQPGQIIERTSEYSGFRITLPVGSRARVERVLDYDYPLFVTLLDDDGAAVTSARVHWGGWAIVQP